MLRTFSRAVALQCQLLRNIHTSALSRIREISVEKKDDKTTVIDCQYAKSPRENHLLKIDTKNGKCPLCALQLNLKHTDVLILSQYIDSTGRLLKLRDTNLCWKQYKLVKELVYMAQYARLLPEPPREEPRKPYLLLNTYYDEKTIILNKKKTTKQLKFYYLGKKLGPIEKLRVKPEVGSYYGRELD